MTILELCTYYKKYNNINDTVVVQANHGVGKSQVVKNVLLPLLAKRIGIAPEEMGFIDIRAAQIDPVDLIGAIFMVAGQTYNAPPAWIPVHPTDQARLKTKLQAAGHDWVAQQDKKHGILFLDEWNRAPETTRQAFFELILDRRVHGIAIPDTWWIIGAINGDTKIYSVEPLEPAEMDRIKLINFKPSIDEFLGHIKAKENVHPSIHAFLSENTHMIDPSDELIVDCRDSGLKTYSRRSWDKLGGEIQSLEDRTGGSIVDEISTVRDQNFLTEICAGSVGTQAARVYVKFIKDSYVLLKPSDVLKMTKKSEALLKEKSKTDPVSIQNLVVDLQAEIKEKKLTEAQGRRLSLFLDMIPNEIASGFWFKWCEDSQEKAVDWYRACPFNVTVILKITANKPTLDKHFKDQKAKGKDPYEGKLKL